ERLWARHLVGEVAVDVEQARAVGLPVDDVVVKYLIVERLGPGAGSGMEGIFPSDSVSARLLQISRPWDAHKPCRATFWLQKHGTPVRRVREASRSGLSNETGSAAWRWRTRILPL